MDHSLAVRRMKTMAVQHLHSSSPFIASVTASIKCPKKKKTKNRKTINQMPSSDFFNPPDCLHLHSSVNHFNGFKCCVGG